jgi:hypothetical protein
MSLDKRIQNRATELQRAFDIAREKRQELLFERLRLKNRIIEINEELSENTNFLNHCHSRCIEQGYDPYEVLGLDE